METDYMERYNKMHLIQKNSYSPKHNQTKHSYTVSNVTGNNGVRATIYWTQYQWNPFWDDDFFNQEKLELKHFFDN